MVIHVILPTYQPDLLWLEGQLRSILDQLVPLRVWLSPDGPDDGAKRVAENLDDGRITILSFGKRAGVTGNVQRAVESALREAGTSDLFAFSDQDDIWLPGNLASGIASLPSDPIAMSTHDARVTNANGTILSSSLNAYESRHRSLDQLSLLIANTISGMTIVATRGAIERALPFPDSIPGLLHDWWLALVVSGVGQIARIETALIGLNCWKDLAPTRFRECCL